MKPSLTTLGVTFSCLCAWQTLCAQKPLDAPSTFVGNQPWSAPQIWGTLPPPKPLPYGYTWNEYRGADIEHPLYAPRHTHSAQQAACGPNVFGAMCCWIDKIFHCHKPVAAATCDACQTLNVPLPPVPALPTAAPAVEDYAAEPAPLPPAAIEPSVGTPPALQQPRAVTPRPLATPLVEAAPPSLLELSPVARPAENPVHEALPSDPAPAVEPKPLVSIPAESPVHTTPAPAVDSSASEDRQLPVARPPVVELAPDFSIPTEPATTPTPPRNIVPAPTPSVPRNVIPQKQQAR